MNYIKRCRLKLVKPARRGGVYVMRWIDPRSGEPREKTTGAKRRREADRLAANHARQVCEGLYVDQVKWDTFCAVYREEHLSGLSAGARAQWKTVRNWINKLCRPLTVNQLDAEWVVRWQNRLRQAGVSESSIAAYSGHLRVALNWAARLRIIAKAPEIRLPSRAKGRSKLARSRPINREEFERIVLAVRHVRPRDRRRWERFLHALWESGFRLAELLALSWDADAPLSIDTSRQLPVVRIRSEGEKAHQDRYQPITREFWCLCCDTPENDRRGHVFPLKDHGQLSVKRAGRIIGKFGERAHVVTDAASGKCATSHDIGRRAFTTRMEGRLTLAELQKWMRHADIKTTLNYYHHASAEQLAAKLWGEEG